MRQYTYIVAYIDRKKDIIRVIEKQIVNEIGRKKDSKIYRQVDRK